VNVSAGGELVIAAFDDGTLRWYRKSDGAELLALFIHVPTKRWIAWTPTGYYTASPGAEELIGWHVNGKSWEETPQFYPASRFRDRFYRPDVVQKILALRDEAKAVSAADAEAGRRPKPAPSPTCCQPPSSCCLTAAASSLNARDHHSTASPAHRP
jgi:hypothetical protein